MNIVMIRNFTEVRLVLIKKDEFEQSNQEKDAPVESPTVILLSIMVPFFVAGFGMVGAGLFFDHVVQWPLYQEVEEITMLVPALLGLKGNLEMTLASRLSTQVNIGKIHDRRSTILAVFGNSIIIQLQSIIVGFLAAFLATIFEYIYSSDFHPLNMLITVASSVATASMASLLLASLVMAIILVSHHFNVNPDNIATPIASSLGDLVTLCILSYIGTALHSLIPSPESNYIAIPITIISLYTLLIPVFCYVSWRNEFVKETLVQGWMPIIMAMLISSAAGAILKESNKVYPIITMYQPVINGVGGNLVAIFASRLSTSIHRSTTKGAYPTWAPKSIFKYPYETFLGASNPEAKTSQILCLLILPGHIVFFFTLFFIKSDDNHIELSFLMVLFYMIVAFFQVIILFLICYALVMFVWSKMMDPDNVCIPYLTATGDFLGVSFLLLAMHLAYIAGNESIKEPTTAVPTVTTLNSSIMFNTTTPTVLL